MCETTLQESSGMQMYELWSSCNQSIQFRVQITMSLPQVKVMFIFSDTSFTGDVLVFKDMAGAFYAVFFGLAFSLIMLLIELTWAAYKDHKQGQVGYIRNE